MSLEELRKTIPRVATAHARRVLQLGPAVTDIVLLLRGNVPEVANAFAALAPTARIHVLGARRELTEAEIASLVDRVTHVRARSLRDRMDYLARIPRPQIMIDAGNKKRVHKLSSLRQLFYFVQPGGFYSVEELAACGDQRYDDGAGENVLVLLSRVAAAHASRDPEGSELPVYVTELAGAVNAITFEDNRAVLARGGEAMWLKLRDWESDDVLTRRHGSAWGQVVTTRPARSFRSRAEVISHGEGPIPSGVKEYTVPQLFLRRYSEVTCTARQIVRYGEYLLPDSWRHPNQPALNNRQLAHSSPFFGRYLDRTAPTTTRRVPGAYYYFDTELPAHFGHIMTDVVSRVWGWETAVRENPEVRPLLSIAREPREMPGYQRQIFTALGIPVDRALIIDPREAVDVERLYAASPQLENPYYIDPDLPEVWRRLADGLPLGEPSEADRIFVSRRPSDKRHCAQTPQIEAFFVRHGFRVIFPEDHSYPDQKVIFARARIIAGLGGSGMFTMMFNPDARVIILSGHSYNAENERLIAAANGNELHYFWGRSELDMPAKGYSSAAFRSGWTFDLRRHQRALRKLIA